MQTVEKTTATTHLRAGNDRCKSQRLILSTEVTYRASFTGTLERDGKTKREANVSNYVAVNRALSARSRRLPSPHPSVLWSGWSEECLKDIGFCRLAVGLASFRRIFVRDVGYPCMRSDACF